MNSSATGGVQYERVQGNEWDGVHENVGRTKISEDEMRMKESANKNKKWREKGDRGGIKKEKRQKLGSVLVWKGSPWQPLPLRNTLHHARQLKPQIKETNEKEGKTAAIQEHRAEDEEVKNNSSAQLTHCLWSGYLLVNVHQLGYRCPRLVSSVFWPCSRRHQGIPWQELVWCLRCCKHGPPRSHSRRCVLYASQRFHTGCRFASADISHRLRGGGKMNVRQGHCCCSFEGLCIHERWEGLPRCTWLSGVFLLLVMCVCLCDEFRS